MLKFNACHCSNIAGIVFLIVNNKLAMLAIAALAVCVVPLINLFAIKDYSKKLHEVKKKIGVDGFTELMASSVLDDIEKINYLIENKGNLNDVDFNGYTALMYAASNGSYDACKKLIDSGANKNISTAKGNTALLFAEKSGHSKIVSLLKH